jgi:hypothetical protein
MRTSRRRRGSPEPSRRGCCDQSHPAGGAGRSLDRPVPRANRPLPGCTRSRAAVARRAVAARSRWSWRDAITTLCHHILRASSQVRIGLTSHRPIAMSANVASHWRVRLLRKARASRSGAPIPAPAPGHPPTPNPTEIPSVASSPKTVRRCASRTFCWTTEAVAEPPKLIPPEAAPKALCSLAPHFGHRVRGGLPHVSPHLVHSYMG